MKILMARPGSPEWMAHDRLSQAYDSQSASQAFWHGTKSKYPSLTSMAENQNRSLVLVVDDEPLLRMDAVDILEDRGFRTIEASDAAEAIRILAIRSDVRVLFTDVNMPPGPSGLALVEEVHQRWPNVLLVVTSAGTIIADKDVPDHGRFIAKPYVADDLTTKIGDMISKADDGLLKPPA